MGRLSIRCRGLSLLAFGRLGWVKLEGLLSECNSNIHTDKQKSGYLPGVGRILTQNSTQKLGRKWETCEQDPFNRSPLLRGFLNAGTSPRKSA